MSRKNQAFGDVEQHPAATPDCGRRLIPTQVDRPGIEADPDVGPREGLEDRPGSGMILPAG